MAAYADTFARFVDLVTVTLDEPETRGEELAAQLYLSRSQLDRVVTAAARGSGTVSASNPARAGGVPTHRT